MGKYIKKFDTHSDYEDFIETEDFIKPNVSYCVDNVEVHYNPLILPKDQYLTFDVITDGTIRWHHYGYLPNDTIYASFDNGETWQTLTSGGNGTTLNVQEGDKIIFKGENDYYGIYNEGDSVWNYSRFRSTAKFNVSGNMLSLIYGDNFKQYTQLPQIDSSEAAHFLKIFDLSCIVSAKDLIIPVNAANVTDHSFEGMFVGNYYLEEIPEILPTTIPELFFYNCTSLVNVILPNNVTNIAYGAFQACTGLTNLVIPNSVTTIGLQSIQSCTSLVSITIPNSVTSIGEGAFRYCSNLASVTVEATTPPTIGSDVFNANASGRKIYVPANSENTYEAATNWSTYAADIEPIPTT